MDYSNSECAICDIEDAWDELRHQLRMDGFPTSNPAYEKVSRKVFEVLEALEELSKEEARYG